VKVSSTYACKAAFLLHASPTIPGAENSGVAKLGKNMARKKLQYPGSADFYTAEINFQC